MGIVFKIRANGSSLRSIRQYRGSTTIRTASEAGANYVPSRRPIWPNNGALAHSVQTAGKRLQILVFSWDDRRSWQTLNSGF